MVSLDNHHLLADNVDVLGRTESKHGSCSWISLGVVMSSTHTSTNKNVVTNDVVVLHNGDESHVVGPHIHIVVWWQSQHDLILSRQVSWSIKRLGVHNGVSSNLDLSWTSLQSSLDVQVVQPQLVVGGGVWKQLSRNDLGSVHQLRVQVRVGWQCRTHNISTNVTTSSKSVHQCNVNLLDGLFQVELDNTVQLEGGSGGDLESAVSVLGSKLTLLLALFSDVSVVLHINTVELGHLLVGSRNGTGGRVVQSLLDSSSEEIGVDLHVLVGDWRWLVSVLNRDSQRFPDLWLPSVVAGVESVSVLVVTESQVGQGNGAQERELLEQILTRLVVVVRIFLSWPILGVTQTKHTKLEVGKVHSARLQGLPELLTVGWKLSLSGSRGNEGDVGLQLQVLERKVVHSQKLDLETLSGTSSSKLLGNVFGVSSVGSKGDGQWLSAQVLQHLAEGLLGLLVDLLVNLVVQGVKVELELWTSGSKKSQSVLSVQELLQFVSNERGVQLELVVVLQEWVVSVQRPVSSVNRALGVFKDLEMVLVVRQSNRCDVRVAVVHCVQSSVLLALLSVQRRVRVDNEKLDSLVVAQNLVQRGQSLVETPFVGTNQPVGLYGEVLFQSKNFSHNRSVDLGKNLNQVRTINLFAVLGLDQPRSKLVAQVGGRELSKVVFDQTDQFGSLLVLVQELTQSKLWRRVKDYVVQNGQVRNGLAEKLDSILSSCEETTDDRFGSRSRTSRKRGWKSNWRELCSRICKVPLKEPIKDSSLFKLNGLLEVLTLEIGKRAQKFRVGVLLDGGRFVLMEVDHSGLGELGNQLGQHREVERLLSVGRDQKWEAKIFTCQNSRVVVIDNWRVNHKFLCCFGQGWKLLDKVNRLESQNSSGGFLNEL
ncbi:hypothetical protein OGAPHI_000842 [Ogataea philodendri]|uniref:Uncharacterized protein n=1 Tax=Ogataea philodendri TaxID=1378263 RepID=A0A9P8T9R5_9ASCO|nr:uncharacterized protein OGAPHI_000842 [Ogataea philodendri]KAH3671131.1 hypothetical protein OGAPHI_000842 [Ogataea philodendri]